MSERDLLLMRLIDRVHLKYPDYGSRRIQDELEDLGHSVGRDHIRTLMRKMGREAVYQKPKTSKPHPGHKIYPYLLRNLDIVRPDQVWASDFTYVRLRHGYVFLTAVMDWYSRYVLSWEVSVTMDEGFCVSALERAIRRHVAPEISNTDCEYMAAGLRPRPLQTSLSHITSASAWTAGDAGTITCLSSGSGEASNTRKFI